MSLVILERSEGVATLTLNNPAERNTMTAEMVADIKQAMDEIEDDKTVGAIIITGAAPAFCAGANLGNLAEADGESLSKIYEGFYVSREHRCQRSRLLTALLLVLV